MPRQNRVTPFGEIVTVPQRGTFFGNRGVLHDADGRLRRAWQVWRWLLCALSFRGRKRPLARPGWYTGLFFLDEATGLAAGHRPCFECRRRAYGAFRDAWLAGNPGLLGTDPFTADALDARLHAERVGADGAKRCFDADLDELPDGVFVTGGALGEGAWLLRKGRLLAWTPGGYGERRPRPRGLTVSVLTPASTVGALRAGYVAGVHPSAGTS
jgi:hypothetical protein